MLFGSSYSTDEIKFIDDSQKKSQIPQINDLHSLQSRKSTNKSNFVYTPLPTEKLKRKKSNKRVKFNDNVDIVYVESYKEFNKIDDDDFNIYDYIDQYANNDTNNNNNNLTKNNNNKKKDCGCTCLII